MILIFVCSHHIACSRDGTAKLWECGSGSCLATFGGDNAPVLPVPVNCCCLASTPSELRLQSIEREMGMPWLLCVHVVGVCLPPCLCMCPSVCVQWEEYVLTAVCACTCVCFHVFVHTTLCVQWKGYGFTAVCVSVPLYIPICMNSLSKKICQNLPPPPHTLSFCMSFVLYAPLG